MTNFSNPVLSHYSFYGFVIVSIGQVLTKLRVSGNFFYGLACLSCFSRGDIGSKIYRKACGETCGKLAIKESRWFSALSLYTPLLIC